MIPSSIPFLRIIIPFVGGIVFYSWFPYLIYSYFLIPLMLLLLIIAILLIAFPAYSNRFYIAGVIYLLVFLTGCFVSYIHDIKRRPNYIGHFIQSENSYPVLLQITDEVLEKNKYYRVEGSILLIHNDTQWISATGKLLLWILKDDSLKKPVYGDMIFASIMFQTIDPPLLKTDFNYKQYLSNKNIHHQAFIRSKDYVIVDHKPNQIKKFFLLARQFLTQHILNTLQDDETGWLLIAMTLGIKTELSPETLKHFQAAGVMHILAVSGLHVGIVYLFVSTLFGLFFRNKKTKKWIFLFSILTIWFYALLTGLSNSIFRASLMLTLILIGNILQRSSNSINSLLASGFIILLLDPFALYDISFILSFSAVGGILLFYPIIYHWVYSKYWVIDKAWSLVAVSLSAQLATLPWTLYFFGGFPVYFLPANFVIVPLFTPFLITCMIGIILSFLPAISSIITSLLTILLHWFLRLPEFFSSLPCSTIEPVYISLVTSLLLTFTLTLFYLFFKSQRFGMCYIAMFSLIFAIVVQQAWQKKESDTNFALIQYKKRLFLTAVKEKHSLTVFLPPFLENFSKELENIKRYARQFRLKLHLLAVHQSTSMSINEYPFQAYKNYRWYLTSTCKNLDLIKNMNLFTFYYYPFSTSCKSSHAYMLSNSKTKFLLSNMF
ncbi:MAG: ComEC family competence protein [Bacteroidales bacterium]|nr:ComEC family competence protein [Bacteroidales bacterium]